MADNGRLPQSDLRPIAGGGYLVPEAAAAWNSLANFTYEKTGQKIAPKGPISSYRSYDQQVEAKRIYGSNAATPGTSNHGWGLAIDTAYDAVINQYGAPYGYQKAWSDASWEPWHFKYTTGHYSGKDPGPDYTSKPSWWKKVKGKLKDARAQRLDKKRRRKATDNPERKADLHKEIGALGRLIDRLTKRRKNV